MAVDEMYLENIDEFINDENKIVTFKWLSLTLQVQCNTAKQMLYKFLETERKKKGKDSLTVTYFVSGLSKPDENGEQAFKCAVVPEDKLDKYKSSLVTMTSCHVYSVQKVQLKDSNALYMTDFEKFKENVFDANKFSSIKYSKAVPRSSEDMELLMMNRQPPMDTEKKPAASKPTATTSATSKTAKKPTSALANMFAKADTNKKAADEKKTSKPAVVKKETEVVKTKEASKKDTKKSPAVTSFFSKQTEKKTGGATKEVKQTKPKSPEKPKPKSPEKKKSPETKATKRTTRDEDSDDDIGVSKKRRRVKRDLLDSSSEEEEEEKEQEEQQQQQEEAMEESNSPIPPTPPPKVQSPEKEPSPEVETEEPLPQKEAEVKGGNSGERKRRRKKKLVPKTYMDKDGFMVTEKVWESDSTDASEVEEPVSKKESAKPAAKPAAKGKGGKKASPQKKSPDKKNSGKQTSLMSFFKKS